MTKAQGKEPTPLNALANTIEAKSERRRRIDWEAVERDYRAGKLTLREMADKHGCTNGRSPSSQEERLGPRRSSEGGQASHRGHAHRAAPKQRGKQG